MKNPYIVLGLPQDATNAQIVKAQIPALKSKKHTMKEITEAQTMLRKPSTRLAADFTFPLLEGGEVTLVSTKVNCGLAVDLDAIDPDKYDSLT